MARRRYTPKLKAQVVLEVLETRRPARWPRRTGCTRTRSGSGNGASSSARRRSLLRRRRSTSYERRIRDLEQLLGKKEVEIALLKNFLGRSG